MRGCLILSQVTLILCAACAPDLPREPVTITVTKDVDRLVQVKCADTRPPKADYPDTEEKLAAIEEGDIFGLAQAYRAGKLLREGRERENEAQISACTGE